MARDQKLNVDITATDRASAKITDVAKQADRVDGKTADVKIDADTSGFSEGLDDITGQLDGIVGKFGEIGGKGTVGGVAAVVTGLALAADEAADLAIEADNLATLTGDSVEYASALNGVWKATGADAKDLQDVLLQMNGVLSTNAEIAETLGINLSDGATVGERFEEVVAALDKIPDAARRSQIASQVFGEEGVRQYNALRNSVDDVSEAIDNYQGKTFNESDVEDARKYKRELAEVKQQFANMSAEIGGSLLPMLTDVLSSLNEISDWKPPGLGQDLGDSITRGIKATLTGNPIQAWVQQDIEAAQRETEATADKVVDPILESWDNVIETARDAMTGTEDLGAAMRDLGDKSSNAASKLNVVEQAQFDAENAARRHREAIDRVTAAYDAMSDELSDESAYLNVQDAFDRMADKADKSSRDMQRDVIAAKQEVINYAEELGNVPPEVVSNINALIDKGRLAEAEEQLSWLARPRDIPLTPRVGGTGGNSYFANGTQSAPRGMAIVGENGPELVDFSGGEKVYNSVQSKSMLGGADASGEGIHVHIGQVLTSPDEVVRAVGKAIRMARF